MAAGNNPLPDWEDQPDNYVPLPLHLYALEDHKCLYCGEAPMWDNYAAYEAHFWANEYEGDPGHGPGEQEDWEYLAATCLGGPL